jgi:hypothetical protein
MPRSREKDAAAMARVEASREIPPIELAELRRLVAEADREDRPFVRLEVTRSSSAKTKVFRLYGRTGPSCQLDPPARRTAGYNWIAYWATVDLRVYLRGLDVSCCVSGCTSGVEASNFMCSQHWKRLGGKTQVAYYTARARPNVGNVATEAGLEATRHYLGAAVQCIAEASRFAGEPRHAELLDRARLWVPAPGFAAPKTGAEALAQFLELEVGNTGHGPELGQP